MHDGCFLRLIEHGADMHANSPDYGNCVQMLIGTYCRNAEGRHACLEVFAAAGYPFPDTAPMDVHRGRIDLLAALVDHAPSLFKRQIVSLITRNLLNPRVVWACLRCADTICAESARPIGGSHPR